jgi:hypothetical protein
MIRLNHPYPYFAKPVILLVFLYLLHIPMSQKLRDAAVIGPDAETQLVEKHSGQREIRCRSEASRALVVRDRQQVFELIRALARFANELE